MVTEIFGYADLPGGERYCREIMGKPVYQAGHSYRETETDVGKIGALSIGNRRFLTDPVHLCKFGAFTAAADITLYNRSELAHWLGIKDGLLEKTGDCEMAIQAFAKWGYRCTEHFQGDFAVVVYDEKKGELFCARDHMGIRPFYYTVVNNGFAFASELRMVKAFRGENLRLNHEYLLDTLVTAISEKKATAYEEIFRLPPGHNLVYRKGKIIIQKYWELNQVTKVRYKDNRDYFLQFRELLTGAVESRCAEFQPVATELSGGLDSSTITCIASKFAAGRGIPFTAFSNTLPGNHGTRMTDEKEHIQKVLDWQPLIWKEVNTTGEDMLTLIRRSIAVQGCFTQQRFHMFNTGIYRAAGQAGAHILLSGFGGDEMVSARTGPSWNDLIIEKQCSEFLRALRKNTVLPVAVFKGMMRMAAYCMERNRQPGKTSGVFTPELLSRRFENLALLPEFAAINNLKERYSGKHLRQVERFLAGRQLQRIGHQHVLQRIEYSCAAAAQFGIQYRYPLLDISLLEACLSFPSWVKHQPGTDRYLFRNAIKDLVPEEIRMRKDKTGAVIPHINIRLQYDRMLITGFLNTMAEDRFLSTIFDFSRFGDWIDALIERKPEDMNYLMPGAFYNDLMIMLWFSQDPTDR